MSLSCGYCNLWSTNGYLYVCQSLIITHYHTHICSQWIETIINSKQQTEDRLGLNGNTLGYYQHIIVYVFLKIVYTMACLQNRREKDDKLVILGISHFETNQQTNITHSWIGWRGLSTNSTCKNWHEILHKTCTQVICMVKYEWWSVQVKEKKDQRQTLGVPKTSCLDLSFNDTYAPCMEYLPTLALKITQM